MSSRVFRPIAAMLSICLLSGAPVQAGPVAINEVIQVLGNYQNPPQIRLRSLSQTPGTPIAGVTGSIVNSGVNQTGDDVATNADGTALPGTGSLLTGIVIDQRGVEIIDQGEVEGTICDCGDILIPGAFPKWPLIFLAAIPLFFIDTGDDILTPTPTPRPPVPEPTQFSLPTPTPTPPPPPGTPEPRGLPTPPPEPVPEPASLLLFGSGLAAFGAALRRRYAKARLAAQDDATKEA